MYWLFGYSILLVVVVFIKFNIVVIRLVRRMEQVESRLDVLENGVAVLAESPEYRDQARWAEANAFQPYSLVDYFGIVDRNRATVSIWKSERHKTYFFSYTARNKLTHEFVTALDGDKRLVSSNNSNGLSLPMPPTVYIQAFDGAELDVLFRRHQQGVDFLEQQCGHSAIDRPDLTHDILCDSMRRLAAHIRTIPLWQLRGVYWFFVRKRLMNNKSIARQYLR